MRTRACGNTTQLPCTAVTRSAHATSVGCQAQHNIAPALTARGRASPRPLKLKALWHSWVLSARGMLCTLGTRAVLFCFVGGGHTGAARQESRCLCRLLRGSRDGGSARQSARRCRAASPLAPPPAASSSAERQHTTASGRECVRHETQRQAGTQAHRRARRQADPVDRKHRCGDCLAARFRRMLDRPAEPVRPLQSARTAVRLSPPHLTSLQLVRQCAGGKHSEPPERLTAAHAAQRTEAPVPHLPRDWARPYHIFAGTGTGRGRVRRRH